MSNIEVLEKSHFLRLRETPSILSNCEGVYSAACNFDVEKYQDQFYGYAKINQPAPVMGATDKRKAEFLAGRSLASSLLTQIKLNNKFMLDNANKVDHGNNARDIDSTKNVRSSSSAQSEIQVGSDKSRCPIWPKGIIGSISHTKNLAICAITSFNEYEYIGIDAEPLISLQTLDEVSPLVLNNEELRLLTSGNSDNRFNQTLAFSAKESLFKALYPKVQTYFGFDAARIVEIDVARQQLLMRLSISWHQDFPIGTPITASWTCEGDTVISIVKKSHS